MPKFNKHQTRYTSYLISAVTMFMILGILATALTFSFAEYNRLWDDMRLNQSEQTHHIAELFSSYLERYRIYSYNLLADANVQAVLISNELWSDQMAHVSREMNSTCNNDGFIQSIMLYNDQNMRFISQQPNQILTDGSYQNIYQTALEGKKLQFVTSAVLLPDRGVMIFSLLQPLDQQRGISINLNLTALTTSLFPREHGMTCALITPYGDPICVIGDVTDTKREVISTFIRNPENSYDMMITSSLVAGTEYSIICLQDGQRNIFQSRPFQRAILVTVGIFLLLLILGTMAARKLAQPVEKLSSAIIRYAETPIAERVHISQVAESAQKLYTEKQDMKYQLGEAAWVNLLSNQDITIQGRERLLFPMNVNLRQEHLFLLLHFCPVESENGVPVSKELIISILEATLKDTIGSHFFYKVISLSELEYVITFREVEGDAELRELDLVMQTSLLRDAIHAVLAEPLIIICSDIQISPDYGESIFDLKKVLRYKVLNGDDWTGFPGMVEKRINDPVPESIERSLLTSVFEQDILALEENIDRYLMKIQAYRLSRAQASVAHLLTEADFKTCEMLNERPNRSAIYAEHIQRLGDMHTLHQLKNLIIEVCARTIQVLRDRQEITHKDIMLEVFTYIEKHLTASDLSVQTVAHAYNMSSSYFSRLFNSATQQSFPQYVNDLRLEKSREILLTSRKDVKEIAEMVGFNSPSYYCVLFQRKYGLSPSKYRMNQSE